MALAEPIKKGGRYTLKEQEDRKLQVHHLHFEENKSALEIARLLKVNRNTINEDIKFWYNHLSYRSSTIDVKSKMNQQIQRMEIQRERFFDYLEGSSFDEKIRLEKLISDLDNRLAQFYSKGIFSGREDLSPTIRVKEIEEDELKEFVKNLVLSNNDSQSSNNYSIDSLSFEYIRQEKCDVAYAKRVVEKMIHLGLTLCNSRSDSQNSSDMLNFFSNLKYDLKMFAKLRGYL